MTYSQWGRMRLARSVWSAGYSPAFEHDPKAGEYPALQTLRAIGIFLPSYGTELMLGNTEPKKGEGVLMNS